MADIELVIKIPKEVYDRFGYEYREENFISKHTNDIILDAICNGTPLPKGHGDLIDRGNVFSYAENLYEAIDLAPPIIKADTESEEQTG